MAWNNTFRKALQDSDVPGHLWSGLIRWVEDGTRPGSFLCAVISNDLYQASIRADDRSLPALPGLARFLSEHGPEGAFFKNPQALTNWPLYVQARNRQARQLLSEITGEKP